MSRTTLNRLARLEAAVPPSAAWSTVTVYARTRQDFESQRAALLQSGEATAKDWIMWDLLRPGESPRAPVRETSSETWMEFLDRCAATETTR